MGLRSQGAPGPTDPARRLLATTPWPVQGRAPVASSQQSARSRRAEPVLITEAEPSLADQHAARKRRYVLTMVIRLVSIVLAAAFYQILWLAIIFAVLGTVLPWVAVVMANDRPPKKKLDPNRYKPSAPDRILDDPAKTRLAIEPGRVIEH